MINEEPSSPISLQEELSQLREENDILRKKNVWLEERIAWFERQIFGRKSERIIEPESDCIQYFPGFEPNSKKLDEEVIQEVSSYKKRKKRKEKNDYSDGLLIPEGLPVEQTILDIPEEEKVCPETGEKKVKIGEEITRQLAHRSSHYYVKEIVRPKYALPNREEGGIFIQNLPDSILPRCRADESLLAEIVTKKFADHLPLYRLSEIVSRDGIQVTRQLLSQWLIRLGETLSPLYDLMIKEIKESGIAYIDETSVQLQVKGKGKLQQAYMWVLAGGKGSDPPLRIYHFSENRKYQHGIDLLEGFSGVFHSDKYGAYETIANKEGVFWQPCWAHIRRKFEEAPFGDREFRKKILRKIRYLFLFERIAWRRDEKERLRIRREKEEPIINQLIKEIKEKIEKGTLLPKSKFREALHYFYGLIPHMKTYLSDPNARIDNNVAERAIRPLAIGRKNWLFVGSMRGGKSTAVLLSLVQTCRAHNINPREYLEDMMRRFQEHPVNRLNELLPHRWSPCEEKPTSTMKPLHTR